MADLNLLKRKGKMTIRIDGRSAKEVLLKALFSKFYPIAILDEDHTVYTDNKVYYGYSSCFDIVEEGGVIPEYIASIEIINYSNHETAVARFKKKDA